MLNLIMLKEIQAFGKCDRRVRNIRLQLFSVEDLVMMMMIILIIVIPMIIIAGRLLQRGLLEQKSDMGSATGRTKIWNHLSLLFPEKKLLPSRNQL